MWGLLPRSKNKNISKSSIIFAKKQNLPSFPSQKCGPKKSVERISSFQYAIEWDFIHQNLLSLIHLLQKQSQKLYTNSQYKYQTIFMSWKKCKYILQIYLIIYFFPWDLARDLARVFLHHLAIITVLCKCISTT